MIGRLAVQLEHVAIDEDEGVLFSDAHLAGQAGVQDEVAVLAVHRHEELRLDEGVDDLELFPRRVTADVDVVGAVVHDASAEPEEVIDGAIDKRLVAGDGRRGEHDGIVRLDLDVLMVAVGHAGEGRRRLALGTCRYDNYVFGGHVLELVDAEAHLAREVEVAPLARHLHVVHHAATGDEDLAPCRLGGIDHLLDARDQGGEGGDDDATGRIREDVGQRFADHLL